jgi:undecaprenyl-diphosphatase
MWYISATYTWLPLYIGVIAYIFYKFGWKTGVLAFVSMIMLVVLTDQVSVHLFKQVFERLRPCHQPRISHLVHIVNGYCGGKFGFVSSHAANTFGFAIFTSFFFKNKLYVYSIFVWATLVSYSRIYLGVHYPSDIAGGALLGILLGFGIYVLYNYLENKYLENNRKAKF